MMIKEFSEILLETLFENDEKEEKWKGYCAAHDAVLVAKEKEHSLHRYEEYLNAMKRGFKGGSPLTSWIYPNYKKLEEWEWEQKRLERLRKEQEAWDEINTLLQAEPHVARTRA